MTEKFRRIDPDFHVSLSQIPRRQSKPIPQVDGRRLVCFHACKVQNLTQTSSVQWPCSKTMQIERFICPFCGEQLALSFGDFWFIVALQFFRHDINVLLCWIPLWNTSREQGMRCLCQDFVHAR
jgi:hypothetical protein